MKVIGITGGVGSGKSRILDMLQQEHGAQVIQADLVAKALMEPGQPGHQALVEAFGTGILAPDGTIDRVVLADRMFHDEAVLNRVNGIIHPMTWKEIKEQTARSVAPLVVVEAALPGEKFRDIYDELWYVYTSEENRINRLLENRGYTREKSRSVMANQPSEEAFRSLADRVIDNNGSMEDTRRQLMGILKDKGQST